MRFWDSSALLPLLIEEAGSAAMNRAFAEVRNRVVVGNTDGMLVGAGAPGKGSRLAAGNDRTGIGQLAKVDDARA